MEVEIRLANVGLPDWEWCVKENQELQTLNYYVRIAPSLDKITHAYTCATDIFELAIFWPLRRHLQRILLTSKLVSTAVEEVIVVGSVVEGAGATEAAEAVEGVAAEGASATAEAEEEREEVVELLEVPLEAADVEVLAVVEAARKEPHRHPGVFVARGKEDMLVTKNLTPGESVYGEKRIAVESSSPALPNGDSTTNPLPATVATKTEYRVWNPFRSKLAAGILGGLDEIFIRPGSKILYLGAASGTSVSHVADIVGPAGTVYAVEFSHRSGRDLINMATHRTNVIPIIEDARHPLRYRMLVGMVDTVFADVAQPDQARIVGLNCHLYLKVGGGVLVSVKANCIDSTAAPEAVFAREVNKMREERIKPLEQLTLEPFERDHCIVVGRYTRSAA
ncbi:MAG: hypothetical protein LQ348_007714 [Seirophora lacunosa]|nr:MAG: hypothetical protein LQ348_007714 [Seirophora lacunosa]